MVQEFIMAALPLVLAGIVLAIICAVLGGSQTKKDKKTKSCGDKGDRQ